MAMVDTVDWLPIQAGLRLKSIGVVQKWQPLGTVLYSSREPHELLQWLCHDDSTINIVLVVVIILNKCNDKKFTNKYAIA